jgi:methylphosphotriester-DNA--protein-cysteine methyltransferase
MKKFVLKTALFSLLFAFIVSVNALAGTYVGSKKSNKYHYPTCKWAQKIKPQNRIIFKSAKEARDAGYVPCKVCRPPLWDDK